MKAKISKIVSDFNALCNNDDFKSAGELARANKENFIEMIKKGGDKELVYAYKVCHIFNMRDETCYKLKYNKL